MLAMLLDLVVWRKTDHPIVVKDSVVVVVVTFFGKTTLNIPKYTYSRHMAFYVMHVLYYCWSTV